MSKALVIPCPTCQKPIVKSVRGTYVAECDCYADTKLPDDIDTMTKAKGKNIQLNLSDSTTTTEKFGG